MKYVLMSGSFTRMEIYDEIIQFLNKNVKKEKTISFITCNFKNYKLNDHFVDKLLKLFKDKNYIFKKIYTIDDRLKKEEMISCINNSSIVFLLGGDVLEQIKNINKYKLKSCIRNDKIVIGMSAGSINMAKKVVLAADPNDNIPKLSIYEGLGLTNINIEPHCDFYNKEHWLELEKASTINEIVVMNDDAYIIVDEYPIYYGIYLILKNKKIYFNGKEITLSYFIESVLND